MLKAIYGGYVGEYIKQTGNPTYTICEQYINLKRFGQLGMTSNINDYDPYTRNCLAFIANVCTQLENNKSKS